MRSPAAGTERYHPAYAMPPRIPYFSPRLAALVMLLAKIQVTRTLAVSSPVDGPPCRECAQRNVRWFSARGATRKSNSPYPARDTHWRIELKGDVSLVSEVFVQNYPYARSAIKFPRATRDVAELTTIRRKARGARVSAFLAVSAPQRQRSRRRATYPFGSGGPFRVMPGPSSENTHDAR